jgi:hypothetical protein
MKTVFFISLLLYIALMFVSAYSSWLEHFTDPRPSRIRRALNALLEMGIIGLFIFTIFAIALVYNNLM